MTMSDEDITKVALKVKQLMKEDREPKISVGWKQLSKEISNYCMAQSKGLDHPAFATVQNAIYTPIRFILGVHRINTLQGEQVDEARKIFNFIKQEHKGHGGEPTWK